MFTHSKCAFLFRSVDENKWQIIVYASKILVAYARVQDINFTSAKKMKADLDEKIANISDFPFTNSSPQQAATKKIPEPTEAEMDAFYAELSKCDIKPIALSLIPEYADSFVLKSRTVPTIFDNFNRKYLDLSYPELVKVCQEVKIELSKELRLLKWRETP